MAAIFPYVVPGMIVVQLIGAALCQSSEWCPFAGVAGALSWQRAAAVGAGAALLCSTRPDGEHFLRFVREYTQRGLGFIPGAALAACAG